MASDSIMPISTQKIALEQFSAITSPSVEPGKQLNQMFLNMMLKSMFDTSGSAKTSSVTTQLNQQLYLNALTQELSENFDLGFSRLQFEVTKQENK